MDNNLWGCNSLQQLMLCQVPSNAIIPRLTSPVDNLFFVQPQFDDYCINKHPSRYLELDHPNSNPDALEQGWVNLPQYIWCIARMQVQKIHTNESKDLIGN